VVGLSAKPAHRSKELEDLRTIITLCVGPEELSAEARAAHIAGAEATKDSLEEIVSDKSLLLFRQPITERGCPRLQAISEFP